jgi:hypothetical protein
MEVPYMNCVGEYGAKHNKCNRREECKFYFGNYHEEIVVRMKQKHSVISPYSCMNDDFKMFEDISDEY